MKVMMSDPALDDVEGIEIYLSDKSPANPTLKIFDALGHSTDVISRAYLSPEPKKHRHTTLAYSLTGTPYPCD